MRPSLLIFLPVMVVAFAAVGLDIASAFKSGDAARANTLASLDRSALRSGDLVFRAGRGWRSQTVRALSKFALTHVGIVDRQADGAVFVVHADPPEAGKPGRVRRVTLTSFADPAEADDVVAFRVAADGRVRDTVAARALIYAARRVPFDDDFDLATPDAMYCTELVWRVLGEAGLTLRPRTTAVDGGLLGGEFMTPRNLLEMGRFSRVGIVDDTADMRSGHRY